MTKPVSDLTERKQRNLIPFKPGQSGNPRGRPKGARNKLGEDFLAGLYDTSRQMGRQQSSACVRKIQQPISGSLPAIPRDIKIDRSTDAGPSISPTMNWQPWPAPHVML